METDALGLGPGDIIQDSYSIQRLLGLGGMGATFQGENLATGHAVAIKVISPGFAQHDRAVDLFRREAQLLRTIQNDAVIGYETTLRDKEGRLYLIMEYLQGWPLSRYVEKGARLSAEDVLKLAGRLADGLAAIHRLGIAHRDISPDNVLVPDGDILGAKIIDFGLASDSFGTDKSIIGDAFAGKLSYASPEQLGLYGGAISPKTDVYSLGLLLMRVAGLEIPGANAGQGGAIAARMRDLTPDDPRLSPRLRRLLALMLRADPSRRVGDVRAALALDEAGLAKLASEADVATGDLARLGPARRKPIVIALAALLLVGAALGAGYSWLREPSAPDNAGQREIEAAAAREIVASEDPLASARALIAEGGVDNLNAALGALIKLGSDESAPVGTRVGAYLAVAAMYDPETYSPETSPFPSPNAAAAQRNYERAAALGSEQAQAALNRLKE